MSRVDPQTRKDNSRLILISNTTGGDNKKIRENFQNFHDKEFWMLPYYDLANSAQSGATAEGP
ncbi:hypothetical protein BGAL_0106g00020 [Botrytis galanthina]|uniref:Uncharacterized protein n=1 Tax=Botrytis galanthina TaxID=278940 RepID=A0A4S8R4D3_9HELO|nr:hypothetical protein BGAL_0106g00020 [Botrytis galanthina]